MSVNLSTTASHSGALKIVKQLGRCSRSILNWFIPSRCLTCAQRIEADQLHCSDCYEHLPFQQDCCSHCGQSLAANLDYCGRCLMKPPPFEACLAAFRYENPIDDLIHKMKYRERPELATVLARLLADEILQREAPMPDLLTCVPLHASKLRQRGFNQAGLISRAVAQQLKLPYHTAVFTKLRKTEPQMTLSLKKRESNVKGCFSAKPIVKNQHIAIIDDVYTTGATARELAKTAKQAGAKRVQIWTIAYTV